MPFSFFYFSFSFPSSFLNGLPKVYLVRFYHSLLGKFVTNIGLISLNTLKKFLLKVLNLLFVVCCGTWHAMCFTESDIGESEHIQSYPVLLLKNPICRNVYISTITVSMATKLGKMVTFNEGLPWRNSHSPVITWYSEITGQTKNISLLPEYLWPPKWQGGRLPRLALTHKVTRLLTIRVM